MSGGGVVLIALGLFLTGGVVSFAKQKMPKSLIVLLGIGAAMALGAGAMWL
ncbi:amidotransferase [Wenjunlia vitaminophila]|uniref:Amidotransferase n=1 Tax=Wenjunlia vitaminophila TaxID=76728 RepID=A0A0T6LWE1_WENVI|nr:hypothetical protein [Wenjunlia vitaminophila]KRV50162.1 amidotransferase [Wenjunlia vitaminophila]